MEEIFTVGDKITISNNKEVQQIAGFFISKLNNKMYVSLVGKCNEDSPLLSKINHIKQPVLTTEDGVDKYYGDSVICVNVSQKGKPHLANEKCPINKDQFYNDYNDYKYFHLKDAAETFVIENTACLSIKDINSCSAQGQNLFDLIKSRTKRERHDYAK